MTNWNLESLLMEKNSLLGSPTVLNQNHTDSWVWGAGYYKYSYSMINHSHLKNGFHRSRASLLSTPRECHKSLRELDLCHREGRGDALAVSSTSWSLLSAFSLLLISAFWNVLLRLLHSQIHLSFQVSAQIPSLPLSLPDWTCPPHLLSLWAHSCPGDTQFGQESLNHFLY